MKKILLNGFLFLGLSMITTACSSMKSKCCGDGKTSACCEKKEACKEPCKDGKCDVKKAETATTTEAAPAATTTTTTTTKKKTK